jgi:hypothetical protein
MLRSLMNKILSMQPPSFKGLHVYDFLNLWFYWIHGPKRWSCEHQNRRSKQKGKWCLNRIICWMNIKLQLRRVKLKTSTCVKKIG